MIICMLNSIRDQTSRLLGVVNKSKDLYYTKYKVQYINEKRSPFSVLSCCCYNNYIRKKVVMGREWKSKWVTTTNVFRLFCQFSLFLFHYIQTGVYIILYLKYFTISQTVAPWSFRYATHKVKCWHLQEINNIILIPKACVGYNDIMCTKLTILITSVTVTNWH